MRFGHFFAPMLLEEYSSAFDNPDFLYEIKFDGIRALIHVGPKFLKVFSRHGKDITKLYPELKNIQKLVSQNMIFDGEIITFKNGLPDFLALQKRSNISNLSKIDYFSKYFPVCFMAFDCLYQTKDLTKLPLLERKSILNKIKDSEYFIKVQYVLNDGIKLFKKTKEVGLEGIVAKKISSTYQAGTRSENWIKIKHFCDEEFYVGGFIKNKIKVSLLLGEYRNNHFLYVGKVSISKNSSFYKLLIKQVKRKTTPFANYQDNLAVYLTPKLKCEVTYLHRTNTNNLRQPVLKKIINKGDI